MAKWIEEQVNGLVKSLSRKDDSREDSHGEGAEVIFETGFGASGLPHIGTFAEVARTTWVRRAFEEKTGRKTKLICFSDDMDALRKVPENLPQQEMLAAHLNRPLTQIPDPFGEEESFAHYNNKKLRSFLDRFDFEYEFVSATEAYTSGRFDDALQKILTHDEAIKEIILPTLREERRATYSPFLPICPRTSKVLMVATRANPSSGTLTYTDPETNKDVEVSVRGGQCKLQWKVDWAMRWMVLGVDYEMAGKDLADSFKLSKAICKKLSTPPPYDFIYELFLDEKGEKISKSRGNGLTIEEWLRYAPVESLSRFLMRPPKSARRLHFDVIPANADDYVNDLNKFIHKNDEENSIHTIHSKNERAELKAEKAAPISFTLLLNLVSASQAERPDMLWGFLQHLNPELEINDQSFTGRSIQCAINYFNDFIKPHKNYHTPEGKERDGLVDLLAGLKALPNKQADKQSATPADIQQVAYDIGKAHHFELREWFALLYRVLLGQNEGARFGSFVALYGLERTISLIEQKLEKA